MHKFLIVAMCVAVASGSAIDSSGASISAAKGIVQWTRCGGVGTLQQVRVEGCEGALCTVTPGTPVNFQADLIPSSPSPALKLVVQAIWNGVPIKILETILANSSVQPGQLYIINFTITPNDLLSGSTVTVEASVSHEGGNGVLEICAGVRVAIR